MALTMSFWIVMRGIGYTLTLLFALSAQAIDYEAHRHDVVPTKLKSNTVLTTRDRLEQLNLIRPKATYTLQEATEHLLHFGALLRARILDTFGGLLYIYYDDFTIAEVEALHKVYQEMLERRYDVLDLVPGILKNPDTRPSRICTEIYAHAEPCLRSSANVCRRIKKRHNLPHPDDFRTPVLNITYLVYHSSKISKQYPKGFSLSAILKLVQRQVLMLTPGLLSGLLYNVRYDSFDDDIRLAERELVQYLHEIAYSTKHTFTEITEPKTLMKKLSKFHSVGAFLKYYINIHIDKFPDENLKRHAILITKRIIDGTDTIDENIQLLGNVYENRTIHIQYLFDLVLPDDVLEKDVIEAKRYLVRKLNEFDIVERYLKIQKYVQATPAQLVMDITGQLKDIDFVKDIAISLRMYARFWRRSLMMESLDELLELFDAYENLRQLPYYKRMMTDIDMLRESLWDTRDVPVEILCSTPRACLRLGLQLVLKCKFVNPEIKTLIMSFLKLGEVCVIATTEEREHLINMSVKMAKVHSSKTESYPEQSAESSIVDTTHRTTTESTSTVTYKSNEITEPVEIESNKSTEKVPTKPEVFLEESIENTTPTPLTPIKYIKIKFNTIMNITPSDEEEEETTAPARNIVATKTSTSTTTTTTAPTTTTIIAPTMTATAEPTTTMVPGMITTIAPTTMAPTTTTTITTMTPTTTTTMAPTMTTMMAPTTTTTTVPTTTTTVAPTTTTTVAPTTTATSAPTTITISPTTTTSSTTITTSPKTITTSRTTTEELPIVTIKLKRSEIMSTLLTDNIKVSTTLKSLTTPVTTISPKSCESYECTSEQSSEETSKYRTQTPISTTMLKESTTWMTATPTSPTSPTLGTTTYQEDFKTTVQPTTDLIETPVTKGNDCVRSSCSEECIKKESIKMPRCISPDCLKRCAEISCDSLMEDCDEEDDTIEKMENHTIECSRVRCKEDSSEMSTKCDTKIDRNCDDLECVSNEESSNECVTLCSSDLEDSCEQDEDDCLTSEKRTVDLKYERTRKRSLCEIRDPHHRRQKIRLARMRAISAAASRADVLRSRTLRRWDQIATKQLYNLLIGRLSRSKDRKSKKMADYLLKRPPTVLNKIEGESWKDRKQRNQIYRLRKELAKKMEHDGKSTVQTSVYQTKTIPFHDSQKDAERIPRKDEIAKLIIAAS